MFTPRTWDSLDEAAQAQFWACLALKYLKQLGTRRAIHLVRHFGSPLAAVQHSARWGGVGIPRQCVDAVLHNAWREPAFKEWRSAQRCNAHILLWGEDGYPAALHQLPDAPLVLYARGDLELLHAPAVAVVGSRDCTQSGVCLTESLCAHLSEAGLCVISGMALGIDRAAHTAALRHVGRSIGVLGTGINRVYPQANAALFERMERQGLLLSEFAPDAPAFHANFPVRNRIISGLSLGVLVVEAALRSGSLITARLALEQNRNVYAIPGPASAAASLGCQELVRQGAHPVFNADDILRDLLPLLKEFYPRHAAQCQNAFPQNDTPSVTSPSDHAGKTTPPTASSRPAAPTVKTPAAGTLSGNAGHPTSCEAGTPRNTTHHARPVRNRSAAATPPVGAHTPRSNTPVSDTPCAPRATHEPVQPPVTLPAGGETGCSGIHKSDTLPADISPEMRSILAALDAVDARHVDAVCVAVSLPAAVVSATLVALELRRLVRRWPGARYTREM